jgi:hypothetical protein
LAGLISNVYGKLLQNKQVKNFYKYNAEDFEVQQDDTEYRLSTEIYIQNLQNLFNCFDSFGRVEMVFYLTKHLGFEKIQELLILSNIIDISKK